MPWADLLLWSWVWQRQLAAALTCENLACSSEASASRMHCGLSASPLAPRPHSHSRCAAWVHTGCTRCVGLGLWAVA